MYSRITKKKLIKSCNQLVALNVFMNLNLGNNFGFHVGYFVPLNMIKYETKKSIIQYYRINYIIDKVLQISIPTNQQTKN